MSCVKQVVGVLSVVARTAAAASGSRKDEFSTATCTGDIVETDYQIVNTCMKSGDGYKKITCDSSTRTATEYTDDECTITSGTPQEKPLACTKTPSGSEHITCGVTVRLGTSASFTKANCATADLEGENVFGYVLGCTAKESGSHKMMHSAGKLVSDEYISKDCSGTKSKTSTYNCNKVCQKAPNQPADSTTHLKVGCNQGDGSASAAVRLSLQPQIVLFAVMTLLTLSA